MCGLCTLRAWCSVARVDAVMCAVCCGVLCPDILYIVGEGGERADGFFYFGSIRYNLLPTHKEIFTHMDEYGYLPYTFIYDDLLNKQPRRIAQGEIIMEEFVIEDEWCECECTCGEEFCVCECFCLFSEDEEEDLE